MIIKLEGELSREAVIKFASNHASVKGCDWPAANVDRVIQAFAKAKAPKE